MNYSQFADTTPTDYSELARGHHLPDPRPKWRARLAMLVVIAAVAAAYYLVTN